MHSTSLNHNHSDVEKLGSATIPASDFEAVDKARRRGRFILFDAAGVPLAIVVSLIVGFSITKIGSMFSDRNVANQYVGEEVKTVVAYSVEELDVVHILIVRHYGCGGVQAAIASSPEESADEPGMARVQEYIQPIREIFANSTRPDIVAMRNSFVGLTTIEELKRTEPGFRALVEENVKANVLRIASDPVVMKHWEHFLAQYSGGKSVQKRTEGATTLKELWITGLVYDIDDGSLKDLEVSVGHPGFTLRGR